jgi:hypothetical protein
MYCIYNNIQIVLSNDNGISFKILQKILQIILVFCLNLIDRLYDIGMIYTGNVTVVNVNALLQLLILKHY